MLGTIIINILNSNTCIRDNKKKYETKQEPLCTFVKDKKQIKILGF